jgi:hypothetical protein
MHENSKGSLSLCRDLLNMKLILLKTFIFLTITGCSNNFGNRLEGENLAVFYVDKKDKELATKLAFFWKDNGLIGSEPQNVRYFSSGKRHFVQLIPSDKFDSRLFSFDERKLLMELQKDLDSAVFNYVGCEIILCNEKFEPILNIND